MKTTALYITLLLLSLGSFAQKFISGTVKDADGELLVGATICLSQNKAVGCTTDEKGEYLLSVKSDFEGKIQASYVGYKTVEHDVKVIEWHYTKYQPKKSKEKKIGTKENPIVINFELETQAVNINQVVVTGTRTPKLLSEAPVQTRLITREDIEKSAANNISDILQQEMPDAEFSYAMNQQTSMNLSGFSGQGVLFLTDGERLAGETMDNVDFQRLDMNNVERIEIVKGAASALYGSQATGGVVNIITKDSQKKPFSLGMTARYGSHNDKKFGANVGIHKGIVNNVFSVQYTGVDTYDVPYHAENDFNKVFGSTTWNFKDKITVSPSDRLKLTAHAGFFFKERLYNEDAPDRYRDFNGGIRSHWTVNDDDNAEFAYNFDQYDKSDFIKASGKDIRDYSNVQNSIRGIFNHAFHTKDKLLTTGFDFMHDYLYSYQFTDGAKKQNTADVFVQYDGHINKFWEVVAALRYDYFSDGNDSRLTPKLSARYKRNRLTVRTGYGAGFRAPSLKEKYMNFDMANIFFVRGNQNLKCEDSHNFNLSAEYVYDACSFTAGAYYNLVRNRIVTSALKNDNDGTGNYVRYMNIDDMNVYGGELTAQARFSFGLNAKLSYNYTKEEVKRLGTLMPYAPARPHGVVLRLDYDKQINYHYGLNVVLNARFLSSVKSEKYNIASGTLTDVKYPSYMMWKLSIGQRFFKKCKLTFIIDNLFNYKPNIYYLNSPATTGRTFYLDCSLSI